MFSDEEKFEFEMGGHQFSYAKRIDKKRCFIGCTGFSGLHHSGKFSTWCPGRFDYPETEEEVIRLLMYSSRIKAKWPKIPDGSRGFTPDANLGYEVGICCGNCCNICFGDPKETAKNYKILVNSGCVIQKENGELEVFPPEEAKEKFEAMDEKHKRLYFWDYKRGLNQKPEAKD